MSRGFFDPLKVRNSRSDGNRTHAVEQYFDEDAKPHLRWKPRENEAPPANKPKPERSQSKRRTPRPLGDEGIVLMGHAPRPRRTR